MKIKSVHYTPRFSPGPSTLPQLLSILGPNLKRLCFSYSHNLDLKVVLEVIESRRSTIKEISFVGCNVTDDFLKSISKLKELDLLSICLRQCYGITYFGLRELIRSNRNCEKFSLSMNRWGNLISGELMLVISEFLPKIRCLRLRGEICYTEVSFRYFNLFHKLF